MIVSLVVRLACVKHLDSIHSEPSPNSIFFYMRYILSHL